MYALEVRGPFNRSLILDSPSIEGPRVFGHVSVGKRDAEYSSTPIVKAANEGDLFTKESLVGTVGCLSQIARFFDDEEDEDEQVLSKPLKILCLGMMRFRVREVVQTEPHPVAIIDELFDSYDEADHNGLLVGGLIDAQAYSMILFQRTMDVTKDYIMCQRSSPGESADEPMKA
jgi:Lon protease-like protein